MINNAHVNTNMNGDNDPEVSGVPEVTLYETSSERNRLVVTVILPNAAAGITNDINPSDFTACCFMRRKK